MWRVGWGGRGFNGESVSVVLVSRNILNLYLSSLFQGSLLGLQPLNIELLFGSGTPVVVVDISQQRMY